MKTVSYFKCESRKVTDGVEQLHCVRFSDKAEAEIYAESDQGKSCNGDDGKVIHKSFDIYDTAISAGAATFELRRQKALLKLDDADKEVLGITVL